MKLGKSFYARDTKLVARELIGKTLVRRLEDGTILRAAITETEAYLGIKDRACHTYGGRRTPRTEVMWGDAGNAYIYFIYGMYFCLNAVTRQAGVPEAVLIRGAYPLLKGSSAKNWLEVEPNKKKWEKLMSGPGKLCRVLKIDKGLNGESLRGKDLWIEEAPKIGAQKILKTPRIGIDYTRDDPAGSHQWPLRFFWNAHSVKSKSL